jgi:hypothetical protein
MGFNTWNHFHMNPNETIFLETAESFAKLGLQDAGYIFLNSDDGWLSPNRSAAGDLVAMPAQFPSGIAALTRKLHDLGFLFGIYGCASETTCGSRMGSLYHESRDAKQYSRMGVDYLKFDDCGEMNLASYAKFSVMRDAIAQTGRPMVYSFEPYTGSRIWLGTVGNSWRTGPDATPHYSSILGNAFVNNLAANLAGPGHFNDADSKFPKCSLHRIEHGFSPPPSIAALSGRGIGQSHIARCLPPHNTHTQCWRLAMATSRWQRAALNSPFGVSTIDLPAKPMHGVNVQLRHVRLR